MNNPTKDNLLVRIAAGLLGGIILVVTLLAAFNYGTGLITSIALVGALISVFIVIGAYRQLNWYETIGVSIVGAISWLLLYVRVVSPSPTIAFTLGFGTSYGIIFGCAISLVVYCVRGRRLMHSSASGSRIVDQEPKAYPKNH